MKIMKGRGPAPDESDSDIDQAPADGLDADGGVKSKKYGGEDGIRTSFTLIIIIYLNFL